MILSSGRVSSNCLVKSLKAAYASKNKLQSDEGERKTIQTVPNKSLKHFGVHLPSYLILDSLNCGQGIKHEMVLSFMRSNPQVAVK